MIQAIKRQMTRPDFQLCAAKSQPDFGIFRYFLGSIRRPAVTSVGLM